MIQSTNYNMSSYPGDPQERLERLKRIMANPRDDIFIPIKRRPIQVAPSGEAPQAAAAKTANNHSAGSAQLPATFKIVGDETDTSPFIITLASGRTKPLNFGELKEFYTFRFNTFQLFERFHSGVYDFQEFSDQFHKTFELLLSIHKNVNFANSDTLEFKSNILGDVMLSFALENTRSLFINLDMGCALTVVSGGATPSLMAKEQNMFDFIVSFAREFAKENGLSDPLELAKAHSPWMFSGRERLAAVIMGSANSDFFHTRSEERTKEVEQIINRGLEALRDRAVIAPGDAIEEDDSYEYWLENEGVELRQLLKPHFLETIMQRINESLLQLGAQQSYAQAQASQAYEVFKLVN